MIMQSIDSLEAEIASEKEALKQNVDELQERARDVVDWRTQVQRHPLAMVGAAVLGGVLIATMFSPARGAARGLVALAGSLAPHAGRLMLARRLLRGKSREKEMPGLQRVVRNARRTASAAASRVADRLHVPGDREVAGARRAKHHPA